MARDDIVVVGAGVIGLDVATKLAEKGYGNHITIIAEHFPGDTSANYTSPWAGANFSAVSGSDPNALRWDKHGYQGLMEVASKVGRESFVRKTPSFEYWDVQPPADKIDSMARYLQDFKIIPADQLPQGASFGVSCTTITVNAPMHIKYLFNRLRTTYNICHVRQRLNSIQEAFASPSTRLVFNCVGNAARELPGVADPKCYPTRGQILMARAPNVDTTVMRHGPDYVTYIIPRPYSGGNVVLGGYMQKGTSTSDTYSYENESIWKRTTELLPQLVEDEQKAEVLAVFAGMRPSREGGARVEREVIEVAGEKRVLIHNYGAGGTGFQAGLGMAGDAVGLAEDVLQSLGDKVQAKL